MLRCDCLIFSSCDWCISILAVSVCCSFGGPLSYGSVVVVFLDRWHPYFRNFYSTMPVDVVRMKSYVFDPACVPMRITINKLYFVPKRNVEIYIVRQTRILYYCYKTNRFHVAVRLCHFFVLFLPHFDVICDLLLNRRTATWKKLQHAC